MKTLEALWYGNLVPFEQFLDGNDKYKKQKSKLLNEREKLARTLSEYQTDLLNQCETVNDELEGIAEMEAFKYGFHLAIKLCCEMGD